MLKEIRRVNEPRRLSLLGYGILIRDFLGASCGSSTKELALGVRSSLARRI